VNNYHYCEGLKSEIKRRQEHVDVERVVNGWLFTLVSTDDNYISAECMIHFCPFCGVALEVEK